MKVGDLIEESRKNRQSEKVVVNEPPADNPPTNPPTFEHSPLEGLRLILKSGSYYAEGTMTGNSSIHVSGGAAVSLENKITNNRQTKYYKERCDLEDSGNQYSTLIKFTNKKNCLPEFQYLCFTPL